MRQCAGTAVLLLAAGWLAACRTVPAPACGMRPGASSLRAAEGVRTALCQERHDWRQHARAEDVFAVFYLPVTDGLLGELRAGRLEHPDFWCDVVCAFHADWVRNQAPQQREAHWRPYFEKAAALDGRALTTPQAAALLSRGIAAHIDVDLPRALRAVWRRHPVLHRQGLAGLRRDFFRLEAVFLTAARAGFEELDATAVRPGWLTRELRSVAANVLVQRARRGAWRAFERNVRPAVPE